VSITHVRSVHSRRKELTVWWQITAVAGLAVFFVVRVALQVHRHH
jgi:hypothetical protein